MVGMNRLWRGVTLTAIVILAAGCSVAVDGAPQPAPNLAPRPLSGQTIKQVLLDAATLARILQQPLTADATLPPWFGGPDVLRHPFESASPADCVGVGILTERSAYQTANVKDVAGESWKADASPARVISVMEGVIALSTAAEAGVLFAKFAAQWKRCDGATLTLPAGSITFSNRIADVRVADSVAAATVLIHADSYGDPMPDARAVGVRGNCLVEVEVTFYSSRGPSDPGRGDPYTSAVEIAHAMMDKVSALS
jgi:PknH-like extracellular domain